MKIKLYQELAIRINARMNCIKASNIDWQENHEQWINHLVNNYLPSGGGFDNGCTIDLNHFDKLIIKSSYHLMNDGYYDGWIDFAVTVNPSLMFEFILDIKGPFSKLKSGYAGMANYICEVIQDALDREIDTDEIYNEINKK